MSSTLLNALGDVVNDAAHAHDCAVLALVRIVVVHVVPRLSGMSRCLRFNFPLEDWLSRLEHLAELRYDTDRNVLNDLADRFSDV